MLARLPGRRPGQHGRERLLHRGHRRRARRLQVLRPPQDGQVLPGTRPLSLLDADPIRYDTIGPNHAQEVPRGASLLDVMMCLCGAVEFDSIVLRRDEKSVLKELNSQAGVLVPGCGLRVAGSGFRVPRSGNPVPGPGFRDQGSGVRIPGSGFRGSSSRFRVHTIVSQAGRSAVSTAPQHRKHRLRRLCASRSVGSSAGTERRNRMPEPNAGIESRNRTPESNGGVRTRRWPCRSRSRAAPRARR